MKDGVHQRGVECAGTSSRPSAPARGGERKSRTEMKLVRLYGPFDARRAAEDPEVTVRQRTTHLTDAPMNEIVDFVTKKSWNNNRERMNFVCPQVSQAFGTEFIGAIV